MEIKTKNTLAGYAFLIPLAVLLLSMSFYPLVRTIFLSFHDVKLATLGNIKFVGLKNFITIFKRESPSFIAMILPTTLWYVLGSVVGQIGFGFLAAWLLSTKGLAGKGIFRSIVILPWVVSSIIISISWRFMYEPRLGILNYLLWKIGVTNLPTYLNNPDTVLLYLIIANIWHGMPFSFIIQTSGLQSISEDIYEAALIDGANGLQRLRHITIPMMRQFLVMNLVMCSMNTINSFDLIYATTKGGPLFRSEVMAVYMYRRAFDFGKLGEGSAVAVIILLLNLILTISYLRMNKERWEG